MRDYIREILKDDENLLRSYELSEAKYLVSLDNNYSTIDVNLEIDDDAFSTIIKTLAKHKMCFDEWVAHKMLDIIIQDELGKVK